MTNYLQFFSLGKGSLRVIFVLLFLFQSILYAQIIYHRLDFDGLPRSQHEVHLPSNYSEDVDYPVVIYLHSYGYNPKWGREYTRIDQVADSSDYIFVFPSAYGWKWNSGAGENPKYPTPDCDDVGFINALIDTLNLHYSIDLARIYSCGYTAGGFMSHKLAGELSHRIAAIASVSGSFATTAAANRNPLHAMPVLEIFGTADLYLPVQGETGWLSQDETVNIWADYNDCMQVNTIQLPDLDPTDGCTVEKISFTNCTNSSNVIYYKVINGGHTWPGTIPYSENTKIGTTNQDINASEEIIKFFKNFENPLVGMAYSKSMNDFDDCYLFSQDSLLITTEIVNPNDNPVNVFAVINGVTSQLQDTLLLFDDGLHGDNESADQLMGVYYMLPPANDNYEVNIFCYDSIFGTNQRCHLTKQFYVRAEIPDIKIAVQDIVSGEPMEDCEVTYGANTYRTNVKGEATVFCETCCGDNTASKLTIIVPGYYAHDELVDIQTDSIFVVNMVGHTYVKLLDSGSGGPVGFAKIGINGAWFFSNALGMSLIQLGDDSNLVFNVEHKDYFVLKDSAMIYPGDTLQILMDRKMAYLEFSVNDELASPIVDQPVTLVWGNRSINTNAEGIAFFSGNPARYDYQYIIEKEGYLTIDSSLYLARDTTVYLTLMLDHTGMQSAGSPQVRVFPSPITDWITIQTEVLSHGKIEIFSVNGDQLYSNNLEKSLHRIDLSSYQKGIYFITISSEDFVTTRKIIKL